MKNSLLAKLATLLLLIWAPACGGGGSSSQASANLDVLLTDAPTDELLSFNVTIESVRLYDADGERTENLLSGTVRVDVLGAATQLAWLVAKPVPTGTWQGVELSFDPLSVDARLLDGSQASVTVLGDLLEADFAMPLVLAADGYQRCIVDFDLNESLTGDGASGFVLDPIGSSFAEEDASDPIDIDDITGIVRSIDTVHHRITIDAWVDDDCDVLLGSLEVSVPVSALLQNDSGEVFADRSSFYAALSANTSLVEIHGAMVNGYIEASRIEIEDEAGAGDDVRMRGVVIGVDALGSSFTMVVAEVKEGSALVESALESIPATQTVHWDAGTMFMVDDGERVNPSALSVGMEVDVRFLQFQNAPFLASRVEIESEGNEYEGTVSDDAGMPLSFELDLPPLAPLIQSGDVSGPIHVSLLAQPDVWLDAGVNPALPAFWIQAGQRVEVRGQLTGSSPSSRELPATEIRIKPGEAEGSVIGGIDTLAGLELYALVEEFDDPFGGSVDRSATPEVFVPLNCVFTGDITDYATFASAMNDVENYPVIDIQIKGIADPEAPDRIIAYEIEVELD
jgi:hypothetical protein